MKDSVANWDGDDWQKHINTLLGLRYLPGSYQPIPDRAGGDYGLEGFSHDGTAFQCYAAEEPLSVDELTEKQQRKITRDIKKLCDNHAQLAGLLGTVKIHTWVLVVPRYVSKHLIKHAEKKAKEVRDKDLSIVSDTFKISIADDTIFEAEKVRLMSGAFSKVPLQIAAATQEAVNVWTSAHSDLATTLDGKLRKLNRSEEVREKLKGKLVKNFLEGQNAIQFLHAKYPQVEEQVRRCKEDKERTLETESLLSASLPDQRLREILDEYRDRLTTDVQGITKGVVDVLAMEATSDWLLRCPLDFPA